MKNEDIISLAVTRMKESVEADRDNREEALDDLNNISGRQWPETIAKAREDAGRPVLTINRLPQFARQVTGDLRNMNPSINILPGDQEASSEVAEVVEGLVRCIQHKSDASSVYERAAESAAQCGMGYFRVRADYEDDSTFDQEILIETIHNPFSVYFDPRAKMSTREDAGFCFITELMPLEDFSAAYPNATSTGLDNDQLTDGIEYWREGDEVVVAEYYWKEPVKKTIGILPDGRVIEDPQAVHNVTKKRTVDTHKVMWAKISRQDVLEGPTEVPCKHIPVVAVVGEELYVGQEVVRTSVIRFAKDPQRLYNYWRSAQTELIALQPKAPYLVTPKQVAGFETFWNEANDSNRPYLPYNPDEKAGIPQRAQPPVASQGMMAEVMTASEDMKATTGVYDAALGNRSNENSGVAIRQRQMESDVSTSIYADNMAKAIACAGRIIVEMIPKIYDTNRVVRILGKDDAEKMVQINSLAISQDGIERINDLSIGKYDVKVGVGPNYATKRQETAESMIEFIRAVPMAGQATMDLIAKNMDWPGADEFSDRLKKLLPPGMVGIEDMPPEEQQQMQQQMAQQQAQQQEQEQMAKMAMAIEMKKANAEASEAESDAEKAQFEAIEQQLQVMAQTGQLNAAIAQIVQEQVARALYGANVMGPPQL